MSQENCTHDCATCGEDCGEEQFFNDPDPDQMHKDSNVKKTFIIASAKGGVGKTFITTLLACELKKKGYTAAILDGDLSGSAVSLLFGTAENPQIIKGGMFPVNTKNNISIFSLPLLTSNPSAPLLWDGAKTAVFAKQFWTDVIWENIDFLLIDTPSDTCDTTQMFFNLKTIDGMIAVSDPSEISTIVTSRTINYAKICKLKVLGLIENFAGKKNIKDFTEELTKRFNIPLLDRLSYDEELDQLANAGEIYKARTNLLEHTTELLIKMLEETNA